jgi:putative transposase
MKYRTCPIKHQQSPLNEKLGCCCLVYNQTLAYRKEAWEQRQKLLSLYETNALLARWKRERPTLFAVRSPVLQNVQERICLTHTAFFRRFKKGTTPDSPRFCGLRRYDNDVGCVSKNLFLYVNISVSRVVLIWHGQRL